MVSTTTDNHDKSRARTGDSATEAARGPDRKSKKSRSRSRAGAGAIEAGNSPDKLELEAETGAEQEGVAGDI